MNDGKVGFPKDIFKTTPIALSDKKRALFVYSFNLQANSICIVLYPILCFQTKHTPILPETNKIYVINWQY